MVSKGLTGLCPSFRDDATHRTRDLSGIPDRLVEAGRRQLKYSRGVLPALRKFIACRGTRSRTHIHRKGALGQRDCIFRLGRPCSFSDIAFWLRGQGVSQFSFMFLLVTSLMLTVCVGVAAWRISDDRPEVTGSISPASSRMR